MSGQPDPRDYISASIHRDFYYNNALNTPTLIKEYANVENSWSSRTTWPASPSRCRNCIEYNYGSQLYGKLLTDVTTLIRDVKEQAFRGTDIFVVDLLDIDTFVIFLAAAGQRYRAARSPGADLRADLHQPHPAGV